jgi:hypothetical protein
VFIISSRGLRFCPKPLLSSEGRLAVAGSPVPVFTRRSMQKIFVTVFGGCADVVDATVPAGYEVEVIDFDNIEAGDNFPSAEAREYCVRHGLWTARRDDESSMQR